nr:MAG: OmpH family outer membrane protein [Hyphomicrobiales bacterium]
METGRAMNSNVGLPILIGAVAITAVLVGGGAYLVGSRTSAPVTVAAPAPIAPAVPVAAGTVDPNAPRIIVIDRNALLSVSSAGLAMLEDVETLTTAADREFQAQANSLQQEAAALQQELAILAPDIRAQRQQEFQNKQTQLQNRMQNRQTQIQNGFAIAGQQLDQALAPILQQLMVERGANLLLDRNSVILASIDVDVTPAAIERLNAVLPTLDVALSATPPEPPTAPAVASAVAQ